MTIERKKTNCHFCGYLCGLVATVEDGKVIDLEPDPSRYPYDPQILAGCRRWRMNLDVMDGDDRINHPLKRVGNRGEGRWKRVGWDEALDDIATRLAKLREKHGAGTLASMIGGPHTSFWPLHRFMSNFGSPNNMGIGQICWNPRIWMESVTFGWTIEIDLTEDTETLVIWGTNPAESDNSVFWRTILRLSRRERPDIVVIDPRLTKTARVADVWLAPRAGTDVTLALSLINVIIEEGIYDRDFVEEWCSGFEELRQHVKEYTPEHAGEVCGVSPDDVRRVARMFARRPSALISGRGIDQIGRNVAPLHRARCILLAITGDLDLPGANSMNVASTFMQEIDLEDTLPNKEALASLSLNEGVTPLQSYSGYDEVGRATAKLGRRLPARYLTSAHPDLVLHAMETGDPYPVRALVVEATNPLLTYADTHRVHDALMSLDLLVVLDYYMTPTAALADYVLPSAGAIERPTFQAHGGVADFAYGGPAACAPYYERKTDYEIFRELGIRLGQADRWPDATFEEACERTLAPAGMTWEEYCDAGLCHTPPVFFKHLMPGADGNPQGFATESGKVELASSLLERLGAGRLPVPAENRRLCSREFVEEKEAQGWTHVDLITGGRRQPYNASMYLNNPDFRKSSPFPLAEMSADTAREIGVAHGDTVVIASDNGDARFKVSVVDIRYGLIHADYGWWHPEWDVYDGRLGGIWESNVNTLTSCSLDQSEPLIGTWSYNAMDCMAKKSDQELGWG